ncbi:MAG: tetratricopeptide repeat protein [Gammaproteobacteria bacterium]|jgi:cytochrome c-type biogenesis protein CcmH|nr:tetratricopeptide repeat protein [Gammaproteobacteria bacterium]
MTLPQDTPLFWTLAAALAVVGLAFVLLPLLRRRPDEGGRRRTLAVLLAVTLPTLALGLYLALGQSGGPNTSAEAPAAAPVAEQEELVASPHGPETGELEARVRERAEDGEAWLLLGQRYVLADRPQDAETALKRATELLPENASVWSAYAEALALARGADLDGEPMQAVYRALELDGKDEKGLELAGLYHFSRGGYGQAAYYWNRLARTLPEGSPFAMEMAAAAREARRRAMSGLGVTLGEVGPREGAAPAGDTPQGPPSDGGPAQPAPPDAPAADPVAAPAEGSSSGAVSAGPGLAPAAGPSRPPL